jgi:hypothetical protein
MATNTAGLRIWHRFEKFLANLDLTDAQRQDGETKHKGVRQVLNQEYFDSTSETANSMLVGSWGKGTVVRPPRDIDVLFVLPHDVYQRYEQRYGNKQSALLQEVKSKLAKYYTDTEMRGDGQVVMVPFSSYAVEVAPAFKLTSGQYWICDTHDGGSYRATDPVAEKNAIEESDEASQGNTRDLVRMLKCWQYACNVELNSFRLERLGTEFVNQWAHRGCAQSSYPYMVQHFFAWLTKYVNGTAYAPGTKEPLPLGSAWDSKVQSAFNRASKACDYDKAGDQYNAGQEWQKIFGTDCPM